MKPLSPVMNKKCLNCYGEMADLEQFDYHPRWSLELYWTTLIIGYFTIDYQLVKFELRTKLRTM